MNEPVRVLHLIESDGVYGAEQVVLALARQAADDDRFPATIGCLVKNPTEPNPLHDRARALGFPSFKLRLRNAQSPADVARLARTLRRQGIGLIHAHGYKAAIAGYAAHLANRTPIVATCHLWFEDSDVKWTYRALTGLERRLYRRFDHVVAVSGPIADRLRTWQVPPARLSEINNGIADSEPPAPEELAAIRARHGVAADSFVVLNVGRLADQKAQADLIEAASRLRRDLPNLRVLILGEGHLRPALEAQIARHNLQDVVRLVGFQENVRLYLAIADAFVLPSVDEGLPIALLEALFSGVAVACTPVGAIPRLLTDGHSALFVPVHDVDALAAAIARLATEPLLRRTLTVNGRDAVLRAHSAHAMYRAYRAVYESVTAAPGNHDDARV
jgi:glycosyltransferase involved in cell wall biosynthesis